MNLREAFVRMSEACFRYGPSQKLLLDSPITKAAIAKLADIKQGTYFSAEDRFFGNLVRRFPTGFGEYLIPENEEQCKQAIQAWIGDRTKGRLFRESDFPGELSLLNAALDVFEDEKSDSVQ